MALAIETRKDKGTIVLDLNGRITLGDGSLTLRRTLHELLGNGTKSLRLNFSGVELIDSSGLAELTSAHIYAEKQKAELALTNLDFNLQRLFEITRLSTVLNIEQPAEHV